MKLIAFILYKIFAFILRVCPKFIMKPILKLWSMMAFALNKKHKKIAFANLDFAYGDEISYERKEQIVKGAYDNLIYNLYEFIANQDYGLEEMDKMVSIKDDHYIKNAILNDEKIILVTAHYASWEMAIPYISLKYRPISVIAKEMKNEYFTQMYEDVRNLHNVKMLEKRKAAKGMVKAFKEKRILAMAIDQSIPSYESSTIEFYGKKVTQTDSPVRIASKFGATIIPVLFIRDGFEKHNAYFSEPIKVAKDVSEDDIINTSQAISKVFEKQIKAKPEDWFWQHKRFKEFNRDIYEQ